MRLGKIAASGERVNHNFEDFSLVHGVHALVDLVDTAERHRTEFLQGEKVQHR